MVGFPGKVLRYLIRVMKLKERFMGPPVSCLLTSDIIEKDHKKSLHPIDEEDQDWLQYLLENTGVN